DRDRASIVSHFGADLGRSGQADVVKALAPVYLEAEVAAPGAGAPQPMLSRLTLSNRHLAYAFTWWGLAATLVFVYLAFAYARLASAAQRLATGEKA
ncbi:MAG: SURF1 family cytochrome oxidase biogenesis protein, partial [Pseudomonadota bacterium]